VTLSISMSDGKLRFSVPGQPAYALEPVGGRRYRLGSPAPDGFFATFRNAASDPNKPEVFVEQPQGNVVFVKELAEPAKISITVDELMRNVIEAAGGEANLRKHKSLQLTYTFEIETQGLSGVGNIYLQRPNRRAEVANLLGAGKCIGTIREYYDGVVAGTEVSFSGNVRKKGSGLVDAAAAADFTPDLNWKKLFKTVTIKGTAKVGDEEAYRVEKTPENGNPVTDYVSTKSFLLLKREMPGGVTEAYRAYRAVDGVQIAFARTETSPMGPQGIKVTAARFDVPMSKDLLGPRESAAKVPMRQWQESAWL